MHKLLDSWKIEIALTLRARWVWPILLSGLVISGYGFNLMISDLTPGSALNLSAFIVQGGLLMSMLLGHALVRREAGSNSEEVFSTLPHGDVIKTAAKILTLFSVILVFTLLSLVILYFLYWSYRVPGAFFVKSISYLALYWVIPFWITGVIGMILGFWFKSRLVYPVLVLIWLFIGPLNIYTWPYLIRILKTDLVNVANFFNLGQTNPNYPFDPVYGFPLEIHRWLQKALWLVTVIFLLTVYTLKQNYRKGPGFFFLALPVLAVVLLPLIYLFTREEQILLTGLEARSVQTYDLFYYNKNPRPNFTNENSFLIEAYDINLKSFRNLRARVQVQVKPFIATDYLVFTLYRDLKVKKVTIGKDRQVPFQQLGDQLKVILPSRLRPNISTTLTFEYAGTSSPYFFANEQAVMLPAYFPWLPLAGSSQAMTTEGGPLSYYPLNPLQPTVFRLRYRGPKPLFTNLPQTKEGEWQGIVPNGVTLAAGMLTVKNLGPVKIYYPVALYNVVDRMPSFLAEVEKVAQNINNDLGIAYPKPRQVFFLSIPPDGSFSWPNNIWTFADHLIVGVTQRENQRLSSNVTDIPLVPAVLTSLNRSKQFVDQDEEMRRLFIGGYEYWYFLQHGYRIPKLKTLDLVASPVVSDLEDFITKNQGNAGLLKSFFNDWLQRMDADRKMVPADVQRMIRVKEIN